MAREGRHLTFASNSSLQQFALLSALQGSLIHFEPQNLHLYCQEHPAKNKVRHFLSAIKDGNYETSQAKSARRGPPEGWVCLVLGLLPGQSKTFPSTAPDIEVIEVIEVGIASRLEISSLGQKASRPVGGR